MVNTFAENQKQILAKYSCLFVLRSAACFGLIYWSSSDSHTQRHFNLELSRVVTTVVVFVLLC